MKAGTKQPTIVNQRSREPPKPTRGRGQGKTREQKIPQKLVLGSDDDRLTERVPNVLQMVGLHSVPSSLNFKKSGLAAAKVNAPQRFYAIYQTRGGRCIAFVFADNHAEVIQRLRRCSGCTHGGETARAARQAADGKGDLMFCSKNGFKSILGWWFENILPKNPRRFRVRLIGALIGQIAHKCCRSGNLLPCRESGHKPIGQFTEPMSGGRRDETTVSPTRSPRGWNVS